MARDAKFIVRLSVDERQELNNLVAQGRVAKNTRQRAMILLREDQGEAGPSWHDEQVVQLLGVGLSTVHRTREQFVEQGLAATLRRKPSPNRQYRKLDGAGEAQLIALACFDEQSKQLIRETRVPLPAASGHAARIDYEYERNGTANLFMVFEPLAAGGE